MHTDIFRGLGAYTDTMAKALTGLKHNVDIGRAYYDINNLATASAAPLDKRVPTTNDYTYLPAEHLNSARALADEINARRKYMASPINSPVANMANRAGFFMFMAFNPATAISNAFQTVAVQWPVLAGKYGVFASFKALWDAAGSVYSGEHSLFNFLEKEAYPIVRYDASKINADGTAMAGANAITQQYAALRTGSKGDQYRAMVIDMIRGGIINESAAQDLLQFRSGGDPRAFIPKVERAGAWMMRKVEQGNRLTS
jgi:hypothetical protein